MSYSAEISRANPTCFLFLLDQSNSMTQPLGGQGKSKGDALAETINKLLYNLVLRCVWGSTVLDRFHVGVLGYGRQVNTGLSGALAGRELVPIGELARNPLRVDQTTTQVDDGRGSQVEQTVRSPIWIEPIAGGKTPMTAVLERAAGVLTGFLVEHPDCFPPLVLNLTDGVASDGDPMPAASRLCGLSSTDGNILLFNAHMSSQQVPPVEFPEREDRLPGTNAKLLFRMSSKLPLPMQNQARAAGLHVTSETRGFVFNADLAAVIRFLDIGTRVDLKNLR
jgi:hypothetical protein